MLEIILCHLTFTFVLSLISLFICNLEIHFHTNFILLRIPKLIDFKNPQSKVMNSEIDLLPMNAVNVFFSLDMFLQ